MGVLSDARIIEKIYDESIIISPFIYDHVQPASVDLTLGKKIKIPNRIENAVNVYDEQQEIYEEREIEQYTLKPNDFIIAFVRETIQLPAGISGFVKNRSSLARVGLDVSASSYVNPGYHGQMTITIKNMNPNSVVIHSGMRICQLILVDVEPEANIDYSKKEDAKYQEEKGGEVAKLYLDREFQEYNQLKDKGSISNFFEQRLRDNEKSIDDILSDEQKRNLGLK